MSNSIAPMKLSREQIDFILSPKAIRARSKEIFELTKAGRGSFQIHEDRLRPTVDYVMSVIKKNYPDGKIPFHSRWGHFRAGGVNRPAEMKKLLLEKDPIERARTELDLVITSVLLDAGAGAAWSYKEDSSAKTFDRSEGLGVASYHMFLSGVMSSDRRSLRADSEGLKKISVQDVETHFQVSGGNPLVGVEGRVALLNGLGRAVSDSARFKDGRPHRRLSDVEVRKDHSCASHFARGARRFWIDLARSSRSGWARWIRSGSRRRLETFVFGRRRFRFACADSQALAMDDLFTY